MRAGAILLQDAIWQSRDIWTRHSNDDVVITSLGTWLGLSDEPARLARHVETAVSRHKGAQRSYKDVAAVGFITASEQRSAESDELLRRGATWLVRRQVSFEGVPTGIMVDGVAVLGIALGACAIGEAKMARDVAIWAKGFLPLSIQLPGIPSWQKVLMRCAASILQIEGITFSYVPEVADVFVVAVGKGILRDVTSDAIDSAAAEALNLLRRGELGGADTDRIAFALAAYDWIEHTTSALARPISSVSDVGRILHQLDRGLYRWTWEITPRTNRKGAEPRKWYIDNEYHLQNLLWAVLAPLFPDLKEEEFGTSIGQLQPRLDLVIPSLALIVEAKFMYRRTSPTEMIEQVAADNSLYLPRNSMYRHIIPVIWDDAARTEEHSVLIQGLKELRGVDDVVVLNRPAAMRT